MRQIKSELVLELKYTTNGKIKNKFKIKKILKNKLDVSKEWKNMKINEANRCYLKAMSDYKWKRYGSKTENRTEEPMKWIDID